MSRQWSLVGPFELRLERRALGALDASSARLRFLYCGLCGSDLSKFLGRRPVPYPFSLGHEFVAEVIEVGHNTSGFVAGDIVTSDLNYRCRTCDQCRAGRSHLCRNSHRAEFSNRALAEFGDVHTDYLVYLDQAPGPHLALTEPLSCVLHAKAWAAPHSSDRVLVIGAGGLGSCLAFALCRESSPAAFEITDEMPTRASLIGDVIAPGGRTVPYPGGEYEVVFDLSGTEAGLRLAASHVKPGGRLCSMSHLDGQESGDSLLGALTRTDVAFKVSYLNGERETLDQAAHLLAREWDPSWEKLLDVVPFEQTAGAFATRSTSPYCKTVIQIATG